MSDSKLEKIEKYAFCHSKLEEICLPKSLQTIGNNAFMNCSIDQIFFEPDSIIPVFSIRSFCLSNIKKICIPRSVLKISSGAFQNCIFLEEVTFEEDSQLLYIDDHAFVNTAIKTLDLPNFDVEIPASIGNDILFNKLSICQINDDNKDFSYPNCITLFVPKVVTRFSLTLRMKCENIEFEKGSLVNEIDLFPNKCLMKRIEIPPLVETLVPFQFQNCTELEKLTFSPNSQLKTVQECAFQDTKIKHIEFPRSLKSIQKKAFYINTFIESIIFESDSNLKSINENAFTFASIKKIILPSSLERIEIAAFLTCQELETVEIESPSNLQIICEYAFSESRIVSFCVPNSVTEINDHAFFKCNCLNIFLFQRNSLLRVLPKMMLASTSITYIDIPSSVLEIGDYCFSKCTQLKYVNIFEDSQLVKIGSNAFEYTAIETIFFPKTLKFIGNQAFYHCFELKNIMFADDSKLVTVGHGAFEKTLIENFEIGPNTQYVNFDAFSGTPSLTSFQIKNSRYYTTNESGMVLSEDCTKLFFIPRNLEKIIIPASIIEYEKCLFSSFCHPFEVLFETEQEVYKRIANNDRNYDSKITVIPSNVFSYSTIEKITIPNTVERIMPFAFSGCKYLKTLIFEKENEDEYIPLVIEERAFYETNLHPSFKLPKRVTSIGIGAFHY
ncbi:hypothetical protein TRFO_28362 [Tritrichomonas foetus]|uniref:Surface antigen BspA-like n=1 Tax=Tritrichomonas foetus TaxID=1144522 RepID=A0A1J4K0D3_9EUKA|nr:hypothetical protein TRFO_28362 [Tritrichomonas foetus]|eukprot:OHT04192.1 hypothetical protein TRFO_28362 [Tritrichomonas foetus]